MDEFPLPGPGDLWWGDFYNAEKYGFFSYQDPERSLGAYRLAFNDYDHKIQMVDKIEDLNDNDLRLLTDDPREVPEEFRLVFPSDIKLTLMEEEVARLINQRY